MTLGMLTDEVFKTTVKLDTNLLLRREMKSELGSAGWAVAR